MDEEEKKPSRIRGKRNPANVKQLGVGAETKFEQVSFDADVLARVAEGRLPEEIAVDKEVGNVNVEKAMTRGADRIARHFAGATPELIWALYYVEHLSMIKKLKTCVDGYMKDPMSKQYNAAISGIRAQSDLWDKIHAKARELGILKQAKVTPQFAVPRRDLLGELRKERLILDSLICEMEVTTTQTKKIRVRERQLVDQMDVELTMDEGSEFEDLVDENRSEDVSVEGDSKIDALGAPVKEMTQGVEEAKGEEGGHWAPDARKPPDKSAEDEGNGAYISTCNDDYNDGSDGGG